MRRELFCNPHTNNHTRVTAHKLKQQNLSNDISPTCKALENYRREKISSHTDSAQSSLFLVIMGIVGVRSVQTGITPCFSHSANTRKDRLDHQHHRHKKGSHRQKERNHGYCVVSAFPEDPRRFFTLSSFILGHSLLAAETTDLL